MQARFGGEYSENCHSNMISRWILSLQRNGRIERQGNENKEVNIYRYVTDKTFDAYLYQMLENKQRFISQIMTSKTPERTCADIDETALDYAEVKALCAGNPLIREQMSLQNKIKELKMERSSFNERMYDLQDKVRLMPDTIKNLEMMIKHYGADQQRALNSPKIADSEDKNKMIHAITINNVTIPNRKQGGEALKKAFFDNMDRLGSGKIINVGEYRGFKVSIFIDPMTQHNKVQLSGEKNYYVDVRLDVEGHHLIGRLDNEITNIERLKNNADENLRKYESEYQQMMIDVEKPFDKADELADAEAKLRDVLEQLTKFELTDDTAQKDLYENITEMYPDIMSGKTDYIRSEAGEAFMPLHVSLHDNVLSMSHTYEQNGDLMYDPRIDFFVDREHYKLVPISYTNSGLGKYEEFDLKAEPTPESVRKVNDVMEFMDTWINNIDEQHYSEVKRSDISEQEQEREQENSEMTM